MSPLRSFKNVHRISREKDYADGRYNKSNFGYMPISSGFFLYNVRIRIIYADRYYCQKTYLNNKLYRLFLFVFTFKTFSISLHIV